MNQDSVFDVNIRLKLLELFGADLLKAQDAYDWATEKMRPQTIIPVTKEVKIING